MQEVHHRPQMPALLDVHLKEIAQIVQTRTAPPQPALLLDTSWLGVALRHDETTQLIAEFARHFLPHWLTEEVAEPDTTIRNWIGEKDPPTVFRKFDVLEMRPALRVDADRGTHEYPVIVLKPLWAHVAPPLQILRLPVLE